MGSRRFGLSWPASFHLPLLFLRGSYLQLALAVIALTITVSAVCMIDLVNRAILVAFVEVIDSMAGRSALQVMAGEGGLFPEEVAGTVGAVPGVEFAVPVVNATAFTTDDSGELLTVLGVDVTNEPAVRTYEPAEALVSGDALDGRTIEDPLVFLAQSDSIALTRAFAEQRHLRVGERIALDTPTGRRDFTVRGLLEPEGVARVFAGKLVVMDIGAAQAVFTRPGFINRIDVVVRRDADVAAVADAIAQVLPPGLRAEAPEQRKVDLRRVIQSLQWLLWAVALVGLVACFLIAFNRLSTHFEARAWQTSVLRAVGVRTVAVWRELLKESLLLGGAGVVLGVPLGIGLGHVLLPMIATATAVNFKLTASDSRLSVRLSSLCVAAAVGLAAALTAAALPAWRAARVGVAVTLRRRGVEQSGASAGVAWGIRGVLLGAVMVALAVEAFSSSAVSGLIATALIATATVMAARPLLWLLRAPLVPVLYWLAGPAGPFAWAAILDNPRRTSLTVGMVGVALGCVLWLLTIAYSLERTLIYAQTSAVQAELVVTSSNIASGWVAAPVDEVLLKELGTVPGVAGVAGNRLIEWPYEGETVALNAFDPVYLASEEFGRWLLLDEPQPNTVWQAVSRGEGIVVSTNFVHRFHTRVRDLVTFETPTGHCTLPVLGITMDFASPSGTIEISRALYTARWNDHQVNRVWLRTAPATPVEAVRAGIARTLGAKYRLRIFSAKEMVDYWVAQVRRGFAPVRVLRGILFVTLLAGLADTLAAAMAQRVRELGVARAVGVRRWHLQRMVLVEALILGLLGLLLASVMGLVLGSLWVHSTFPHLLGYVLQLHVPFGEIALLAGMTVLVGLGAAVLPALQAARLEPAVALRYE